jgi:hypothetical protein
VSAPATGSESIFTAASVLPSRVSLKPNADALKTKGVFSSVPTETSAPEGASLTAVTLMRIVRELVSVSAPPLAVPPSSFTRNVKLAYCAPFASAPGVYTSLPAAMSAAVTV